MTRTSSLFRLQQVDLKLQTSQARLAEIESILADTAEINALHAKLQISEEKLNTETLATKKAEHLVATQRAKIDDTEGKLYGGLIQNPKELHDLQRELESLKRYLETLEDSLLEAMMAQEQAEETHAEARRAYEECLQSQAEEHTDLRAERATLLREIERLGEEREVAKASVLTEDLALYERLQKDLAPPVVATVEDNCCSICGMTIPASKQQAARSELLRCSQCGRLIYAG
jgi:predicted  nucleic acid-binding Zn-ribbon protein